MSPPVALLNAAFSFENVVARWHDLVEYARRDPVTFVFWCVVWVCSFLLTALLLRMLFTRWGDTNVTRKTMAVSLLAHFLLGMLSTRWDLELVSKPAGDSEGEVVVRPSRRSVVDGEQLPQGQLAGKSSQVWNRAPDFHGGQTNQRDRREATGGVSTELPDHQPDLSDVPEPVALPELPLANKPSVPAEPQRSTDRPARPVEISQAPIAEETAESRSDSTAAAPSTQRSARSTSTSQEASPTRVPRPETPQDLRIDVAPGIASSAPTVADPKAMVRRPSGTDDGRLNAAATPSTGPIYDAIEGADEGAAPRTKGPTGPRALARGSRRPVEGTGPGPGLVERTRTDRPTETGDSGSPQSLASRTGTDLPFVEGVIPDVVRSDAAGAIGKDAGKVPASYRLRGLPGRKKFAIEMGATDDSERAVEASLEWLARHQHPKGYWQPIESILGTEPEKVEIKDLAERQRSGLQAESGLTALALLAFLGANYTHEDNQYADNVDRAIRWLIAQQDSNGYLGGRANKYASMYCHGMAAIALGEAYGMTKDASLKEPLARAVSYIVEHQNSADGGWRYLEGQAGDMSMFGWQLMALKSAHTAGLKIPIDTADRAYDFLVAQGADLKLRGLSKEGGLASYRRGRLELPKPAMTAESLFCRQILGWKRDDPGVVEAVEYIQQHMPRRSQQNLYYWYYGTLAMYHYGGEPWKRWNEAVRDNLVADQRSDGDFAGSWNPRAPWGDYGGRVFSTALSTLCLEVYYRFLPLYQIGAQPDDTTKKR